MSDGRIFEPVLTALAKKEEGGIAVLSPAVGGWRGAPRVGDVILPNMALGELEILGKRFELRAPAEARGAVRWRPDDDRARLPVAYGDRLLVLDPAGVSAGTALKDGPDLQPKPKGLVFSSPSSGRFYSRPAPDKPPFVKVGDTLETGQPICLLEVMKTFHRVAYGGPGLPPKAQVLAILVSDGDDLDAGQPILQLGTV